MKKAVLIGLAILFGLLLSAYILKILAFGPVHKTMSIDLDKGTVLIAKEVYNADLADIFYDVSFIVKMDGGKEFDLGSVTFHDEDWKQSFEPKKIGDWWVFPVSTDNYARVIMVNPISGKQNDITFRPVDLRKDTLYKGSYSDVPDHLFKGSSRIVDVSDGTFQVNYEYKAKAAYPALVHVSHTLEYEFNTSTGLLDSKRIFDRVI